MKLKLDSATLITLIQRFWAMGSGVVTIAVIGRFLSPEVQGYYYTFLSLIALQLFFEMGLNSGIIQIVSHDTAKLRWRSDGRFDGDKAEEKTLQGLINFMLAWFGVGCVLLIIVLVPTGLLFFKAGADGTIALTSINTAWTLLVVCTALNLVFNGYLSVLEGCGRVADVGKVRLAQTVTSSLAVWTFLITGGGLYSLVFGSAISILVGTLTFHLRFSAYIKQYRDFSLASISEINWKKNILPFQWRLAVSYMSGYFAFHSMTPIVFSFAGPKAAGQFGMSLQILSAITQAALVWITVKAPKLGTFIANRDRESLDSLFSISFKRSFVMMILAVVVLNGLYFGLSMIGSPNLDRVLSWPLIVVLSMIALCNHVVFALSIYLRAHKQEPFLSISILNGIVTFALSLMLVPFLGVSGAVYSYAFGAVVVGLFGGSYIFFKKRAEWRSA